MYEVKQKIIDWLTEDNNPSVKFLTQTQLLNMREDDSDVSVVRSRINSYIPIKEILSNQIDESYWFDKGKTKNYKKYLGTFWQLIFLSEMYAQRNKQIENAIEHIFSTGQASNGGFSVSGTNSGSIPCLTANIVRSLIFFGYWGDERTKKAVEFILTRLEEPNGIRCFPMENLLKNCYMTTPKIIHALGSIPLRDQTSKIKEGIEHCVNILLKNQIYKYVPSKNKDWLKYIRDNKIKGKQVFEERDKFLVKNPIIEKIAKPGWLKFGFPLNYNSDILDAMKSLVLVNETMSPKLEPAVEIIKSKCAEGKWYNEKQYKSPMYTQIERYKEESKWLTYHSLVVLKHFEGSDMV